MADSLYGAKKPTKLKGKEISSSNSFAFSSSLSSLISSSTFNTGTSKEHKNSKSKSDLFTAHNKNVKKRAAKDLEAENGQKHKTKDDIGVVESADLHRSKRRMEEKVRLYNAMKRGEYVRRGDYDDRGLVDFDRKWAEQTQDKDDSDQSDDLSDDATEADSEITEYTDEFGRLRKGTKKQAEKEQRRTRIEAVAKADAEEFAARPQAPTNIIYGDAVQHQAYNPDKTIAEQMAELARKRDKSATPPPDTHFDASAEVRTKGTAFYNFSHDAKERQREMEELEKTRLETERVRQQREEQLQKEQAQRSVAKEEITLSSDAQRFFDELEMPPG